MELQINRLRLVYIAFAFAFALGISLFMIHDRIWSAMKSFNEPRIDDSIPADFETTNGLVIIGNVPDWNRIVERRRCVVFVYGVWSSYGTLFKPEFESFSGWCRKNGIVPILVDVSDQQGHTRAKEIAESLSKAHERNGAIEFDWGRVYWLEDGEIVDFEWCQDLLGADGQDNSMQNLIQNTREVFNDK